MHNFTSSSNLHLFHELRSVIRSAQAEAHRHCANRTEHCSHSQQGKPVPLQDVQSEVDIMISQNPKSKLLLMDTPMIYSNATDHCSKASTISSFLPPFLCFHARGEGISHVFVASESTSTSASTLKINMKACTVVEFFEYLGSSIIAHITWWSNLSSSA